MMGQGQISRIFGRTGNVVEIYNAGISAPERVCRSVGKSCKLALKKAIGKQVLTPFELYTCL